MESKKNEKINDKIFDIYCDKCDNILDITRTVPKSIEELETNTPNEVSDSDDDFEVNYEDLLKKIEADKKLTSDEINSINIKDMVKNEYYKKMAKKGEIKKQVINMIDDNGNSDDNTHAYMICQNCGFNKPINPGFRVISRNAEGSAATFDYVNDAFYRNRVHIRTMPITRNFKCLNKNCPVNKGEIAPEAIFFRKNANTHETIYVCKICLTVKIN